MKGIFYAVYDSNDMVVTICETYNELAKYFERKNSDTLRCATSRGERIRYNNNWYSIYKIQIKEEKSVNKEVI